MGRVQRAALPVFLAVGVLFLAALGACSKAEKPEAAKVPSVHEVFLQGVEALQRNDVDSAVKAFTLIVEKSVPDSPERPLAYLYLGQIAYRSGNMEQAIKNFEVVAKLKPDFPQARLSLGNAYFAAGKVDEAIATWEQLARDQPNLASVHNNLGIAYTDKGELDKAITHLEQTIALAPDNYRAHENLAIAYRKKGLKAEADTAERKAQAIKAQQMAQGNGERPAPPEGAGPALPEAPAPPTPPAGTH